MPEYNGAQKIGFLLAGGAGQIKRQAFDEGRLNTAKTEEALANARSSQLKATATANAERAKAKFQDNYTAVEVAKGRDPKEVAIEAELIGNMMIGGTGADFSAIETGRGAQQTQGFRDILADPTKPAEVRLRAGQGIQGKVTGDFAPIGTHGIVDLTKDDQQLIVPSGGGSLSNHAKDFEFRKGLHDPEDVALFDQILRQDRVVNAGGVPSAVPGINPTGTGARPLVSPETVKGNEAALTEGKTTGTKVAAQKADYPMVKFTLDQNKLNIQATSQIIDELLADPKLWQAQGLTRLVSEVPGTEGAYIKSKLDVLGNKQMLQTLINLRAMSKTGGAVGNVSDREGATMRSAQAAIADQNISMGDLLLELRRLRAYNDQFQANMEAAFNATYDKDGNPLLSIAPRGTPQGEDAGPSIEDEIINRGDGEYDGNGNLVRADGWIFMKDAAGNAAWVSPDGTDYEEVAQ